MTEWTPTRRNMIKLAASAGAITGAFATTGRIAHADNHAATPLNGTVTIHKLGAITLHSYTAPEASAMVNTHIVETANTLHVIDAQFIQSFAVEARAYADSLGKPIAGVYLSHSHPDHLLGAAQFADTSFVTSAAVRADVDKNQDMYRNRKEQLSDTTDLYLPAGTLSAGAAEWDGVNVIITEVNDAEAAVTLTFAFPDAGLVIAQDLLYASAHAFPLGNAENWITALRSIAATDGLKVIGAGHGLPASPGAIDDAIAYLSFQQQTFAASADAETAINALSAAYPNYGGKDLLNFVNFRY
ncbi:MAG: MBL fold metallo-hydrolase [Pseudomonadota bacterium]